MKNENEIIRLRDKIMEGASKAVAKVIAERQAKDEEISIYRDGKVVTIKARDLK